MKKRRFLSILLAVAMTASLASCTEAEPDSDAVETSTASSTADSTAESTEESSETTTEEETTEEKTTDGKDTEGSANISDYVPLEAPTPAVWKATDPKTGNELYLMGTIHVYPTEAEALSSYVDDIYESCDGIAVEYNIDDLQNDQALMVEYTQYLMYMDGTTIKDHISEETYEAAKAALKKDGDYVSAYDYFCPGLWLSDLQNVAIKNIENLTTDGVDMTYIQKAKKDNKEIVNIETLEIQASVSTAYTDELADYMLKDMVETYTDYAGCAEELGELYSLWAQGESDKLLEFDEDEDIPDELKKDYDDFNEKSVFERNKGMAEKASEYLKDGKNYFFMVGAMHFAGDRGVDDLLADMGYTVERIH